MEGNLRFKIDWASLTVGSKFIVFALFYFVFEDNFFGSFILSFIPHRDFFLIFTVKQKAISCKVCHFQVRLFPNILLGSKQFQYVYSHSTFKYT